MSCGTSKQRLVRELPKNADIPKSPSPFSGSPGAVGRGKNHCKESGVRCECPSAPRIGTCPHAARRAFRVIEGGENHGSSFNPARTLVHASLARRGCRRCREDVVGFNWGGRSRPSPSARQGPILPLTEA